MPGKPSSPSGVEATGPAEPREAAKAIPSGLACDPTRTARVINGQAVLGGAIRNPGVERNGDGLRQAVELDGGPSRMDSRLDWLPPNSRARSAATSSTRE